MSYEYKTRYFNKIEYVEDKNLLKKSSTNIEKIKSEYDFYYLLPHNIQRYFVQPFNLEINDIEACYYVEKFFMKDAAFQIVYRTMTDISFKNLLQKIATFQEESPKENLFKNEIDKDFTDEIVSKCIYRTDILLKDERWIKSEYKKIIDSSKIDVKLLIDRLIKAYNYYSKNRKTFNKILSHGDLCMSNILWSNDMNIIKFIDPKGADHMILDEYYDIAKLSHSIVGNYDQIIYENYHIDFNKLELIFFTEPNTYFLNYFKKYLEEKNIDFDLQRVYEASIFISMLYNHLDDDKRVFAFILNCNKILTDLGF